MKYSISLSLSPDLLAFGFNHRELSDAMYRLEASEEGDLLYETEALDTLDAILNPGDSVSQSCILDAVTTTYSRFSRTMAALARTLNKYSRPEGLSVDVPVIGKPKKSGPYAMVTAQFPYSDGQTISVSFHAPDSTPKQLSPDDELISFRWLLNKRDVTHLVAPEMEQGVMTDISLDQTAQRITQIVKKNSDKFQAKQKEVEASRAALAEIEQEWQRLSDISVGLQDEVATLEKSRTSKNTSVQVLQKNLRGVKDANHALGQKIIDLKAEKQQESENSVSRIDAVDRPHSHRDRDDKQEHQDDEAEETDNNAVATEATDKTGKVQEHADNLSKITAGDWDNQDLETIYQAIASAVAAFEEAGVMEQYDALVGEASLKYADLDQQAFG